MNIVIVINAKRLTPELKSRLESNELTEKFGIQYETVIAEPGQFEDCFANINWKSYNACVIGGGDGTVNYVVSRLITTGIPIAILPLGTFNVLAKSLEYPDDIDSLFEIIKNGKTRQIDLGEVNGKLFLNHAWLGTYYYILKNRKKHSNKLGTSRFLKLIFNTFWMFKHVPIFDFKIKTEEKSKIYKTCLVFISNNESTLNLFNFGARQLLSTGLLYINILNCHTRWQLFVCFLSVLLFGPKHSKWIKQFNVNELAIAATRPQVDIVLDGELLCTNSPLNFINQKNILNVYSP